MAYKLAKYDDIRDQMRPGDVIAFGGKTGVSDIVKTLTCSPVSHVAVVLQTQATYEAADSDRFFNLILESTKFDNFLGVGSIRLSDRLRSYHGQAWWLPLDRQLCQDKPFDQKAFFDFLYAQRGKPFDVPQAFQAALDALERLLGPHSPTHAKEDLSAFFCSELVAAGLEAAGMVGDINASEVTPIDLCRWRIYEPEYCQIYWETPPPQEEVIEISRYNCLDPAAWCPM